MLICIIKRPGVHAIPLDLLHALPAHTDLIQPVSLALGKFALLILLALNGYPFAQPTAVGVHIVRRDFKIAMGIEINLCFLEALFPGIFRCSNHAKGIQTQFSIFSQTTFFKSLALAVYPSAKADTVGNT